MILVKISLVVAALGVISALISMSAVSLFDQSLDGPWGIVFKTGVCMFGSVVVIAIAAMVLTAISK